MAEETLVRPFSEWVAAHRRGELDLEITAALAELTTAVHDLGKAGSVSLKISVKPGGGRGRTVLVVDAVTVKAPEARPRRRGGRARRLPRSLRRDDRGRRRRRPVPRGAGRAGDDHFARLPRLGVDVFLENLRRDDPYNEALLVDRLLGDVDIQTCDCQDDEPRETA